MKNAKRSKKGVVDVQFNWIFILIAGFVIFAFIISVVYKQKDKSDERAGINSVNQITTLLKGKQQTANVYSELSIPNSDIEFRCEGEIKYFTYRIGNYNREELPTYLIFSRGEINTNKMIIWTQEFNLGFPAGIFSYVTTPDSLIIIYADPDDSDAAALFNAIPSNITRVISKNIADYDYYNHKTVVCFDGDCPAATQDYIKIKQTAGGVYGYGDIIFHSRGRDTIKPYVTNAAIYGAIFSNDPKYYECQMNRAFDQYNVKRSLLEKRMTYIYDQMKLTECGIKMDVILKNDLSKIDNLALTTDNAAILSNKAKSLELRNTDLGFSSCPRIY
ncbi:MAG TPA: hypothetical protein VEC16_02760 [Alphaproteobacteria bacterium]|nr:hypothetical protein [Alphaproteobacteria bacterium]